VGGLNALGTFRKSGSIGPKGPPVEPVQFVTGVEDQSLSIPKELMQSWNLPEGIFVSVRPAP